MTTGPQCVRCGYCCKVAPCAFGEPDAEGSGCRHLVLQADGLTYACARYEEIAGKPDSRLSPAFGEGCSSSLFNTMRAAVIEKMGKGSQ